MGGGAKVVVEAHRHDGVFIARGKEDALVTRNLVPGVSVYAEKRISTEVPKPDGEGTDKVSQKHEGKNMDIPKQDTQPGLCCACTYIGTECCSHASAAHARTHTSANSYNCNKHAQTDACTRMHTHTHTHIQLHTYTHTHTCMRTHAHTHTHTRTQTHTYTHTHTHTHSHTYWLSNSMCHKKWHSYTIKSLDECTYTRGTSTRP
jgi:hypothetical protein